MHDLESYLSVCAPAEVTPQQLKTWGRLAASELVTNNVPMNTTIQGFVKKASLNPEQVKRIVEEANNVAFLEIKKGGKWDQNIEYPVADFDVICGAAPLDVGQTKVASVLAGNKPDYIRGAEGATLESMFGVDGGRVKTAAAVPQVKPWKLQHQLRELESDVAGEYLEVQDLLTKVAQVSYDAARYHAPEDVGLAIIQACETEGVLELIKEALDKRVTFTKTAMDPNMAPSPMSPFTGLVQELESASVKLMMSSQQMQATQIQMDALLTTLRGPTGAMGAQPQFQPAPGEQQMAMAPPGMAPPGAGPVDPNMAPPPQGAPING